MFDELKRYKQQGHFFFKPTDKLALVCTAPNFCSGLYLVNALEKGKVNLVYIGISGRKGKDGRARRHVRRSDRRHDSTTRRWPGWQSTSPTGRPADEQAGIRYAHRDSAHSS